MESVRIVVIILAVLWFLFLMIPLYSAYSPSIDIIKSEGKYTILLWYNDWDMEYGNRRTYKILL